MRLPYINIIDSEHRGAQSVSGLCKTGTEMLALHCRKVEAMHLLLNTALRKAATLSWSMPSE